MSEFSLSKNDRLRSRKSIGELFAEGESFFIFPLKVVYRKLKFDDETPVKAAFSVSKRNFKRAVKRNYLKRLMRETYRLNKGELASLLNEKGEQLGVMFIFAAKEEKDFQVVEKGMLKSLEKLKSLLS
ncbi:ribonuclease P protein component [Mangrovibacterium lignilyticum]|uniref:ribonuclease P protein component n=1 Tax=Mangrovibacterium lignilyticum TaxID=2668052 RepID=UPI0013D661DC|nr:ribonuclease P protein component [Mangrovibacterium lignilyticum]